MPLPSRSTYKLMAFADGENLVARYRAMVAAGAEVLKGSREIHIADEFVWHPNFGQSLGFFEVVRAHYYTSVIGDVTHVAELTNAIRAVTFSEYETAEGRAHLYPKVFKKPSKSNETSTVDIWLTVDMMAHAYQGHADKFLLLTGDADFVELVKAVVARGCRVIVAAFSSGLSGDLLNAADEFIDLDPLFFKPELHAPAPPRPARTKPGFVNRWK